APPLVMLQSRIVPSASRVPIFKPTLWLIMMVCANQLLRSSGPSTVNLKSFCALIWSSQLIGGMSRSAPSAAFLKESVTSASARKPAPEAILPSRITYQRPISSSPALSSARRLRSLSRSRKAGYRHAAYFRSCAIPHRMILNFIAESMVSSSPASTSRLFVIVDQAILSAVCGRCAISRYPPYRRCCSARWCGGCRRGTRLLRLQSCRLHHLRPFFDVLAQVSVELGGRHHQRHRALLVPRLLHIGASDHFS